MNIKGIEFNARPLTRSERRALKKEHGVDLIKMSFDVMASDNANFEIDTDSLDAVLDIAYAGRDEDLDKIGISGQIELFSATFSATFGGETEEEKNS